MGALCAILLSILLAGIASAADPEMVTEWFVTVGEHEKERTTQIDSSAASFQVAINQDLAPGWACSVRPEVSRGVNRWRWVTCSFLAGHATVQIKTDCRSERAGSRYQKLWLEENVSVQLSCRSGTAP
jgi:hypothetical protein